MTKHNFYVITGGPGGGKTSVLNFLASKGHAYVADSARQIIRERLSQGLSPRPEPAIFAQQIFFKDFENYISSADVTSLLFFDRSFIDGAYLLHNADPDAYNKIQTSHLMNRYNQKVFITPPWKEIYSTDNERDQTAEEAIEVYNKIFRWYREHEYDMLILPMDTIENRANFILDHVSY